MINAASNRILDRIQQGESYFLPKKLWERDLLECARRWPDKWHDVAICSGFTPEKIAEPWPHKDAGRLIELPTFKVIVLRRDAN
jgi:hypothetical protein